MHELLIAGDKIESGERSRLHLLFLVALAPSNSGNGLLRAMPLISSPIVTWTLPLPASLAVEVWLMDSLYLGRADQVKVSMDDLISLVSQGDRTVLSHAQRLAAKPMTKADHPPVSKITSPAIFLRFLRNYFAKILARRHDSVIDLCL